MTKYYAFVFAFFSMVVSFAQTGFYPSFDASGSYFGSVVDISGNDIVVNSNTSIQFDTQRGKVYVFNADGNTISQTAVLYPNFITPLDGYANTLSIDGEFLAVGAVLDDQIATNAGAVHIFRKVDGNWNYFQKITTSEASTDYFFGSTIKIHRNEMFISAIGGEIPGENPNTNRGAVYTLHFDGTQWVFMQKLLNPNALDFGRKIRCDNNRAIISAKDSNSFTIFNLYEFNNGEWQLASVSPALETNTSEIRDFYFANGHTYTISGFFDSYHVQTVDYNGSWTTTDLFPIVLPNNQSSDQISDAIVVSGDKMFIGSRNYILQTERKFPLFYFKEINNNWIYQQSLFGEGTFGKDDLFGSSLAVSGNQIVAGAMNEGDILPSGKAYLIDAETLNTKTFDQNSVALYPNPTSNTVYIQNNDLNKIVKFEIYSITGKLLSAAENVSQLSLENFASGMYLVKLHSGNGTNQTYKIVKK